MVSEIKAESLGRAARRDMQITPPLQPVVRRGVRLRKVGESVVLDGSDRPQVFNGKFAQESLLPLVAACDGSRGHGALAQELGFSEEAIYKALVLLWAAGVIEEGDELSTAAVPDEFACMVSRLGNSTGVNRSLAECVERLARRPVRLAGDDALRQAAERAFGGVCPVLGDSDAEVGNELVVFFETVSSRPGLSAYAARCAEQGKPLLRVRADELSAVMGPYVDTTFTPCIECGTWQDDELRGEPPEHAIDLIAGVIAHHVTALISRATMTSLPLDASVIDLATLATKYVSSVTRPGCPTCSNAVGPTSSTAPAAAVYEASVAMPPRNFFYPKGHLGHYQSGNIRLTSEFREWPSCPAVALPAPELSRLRGNDGGEGSGDAAALTLADLSLLLQVAFGLRETSTDEVRRWTAAGGNIGCTTAFVLCRDENILPVGVYAYVEKEHRLAKITTSLPSGEGPVGLVVTGNLRKVMRKYGTFGFRLAMLDSGCNLTSAREVAEQLNMRMRLVHDWDDQVLCDSVGTSMDTEPIVAVAELGAKYAD